MKNPFGQLLLPKAVLNKIPAIGSQEGKGENAIAYVKFFMRGFTWYGTEYDPARGLMFGKTYNTQMQEPDGELGYWDMHELSSVRVGFSVVERDTSFKPTPLKECVDPCAVRS